MKPKQAIPSTTTAISMTEDHSKSGNSNRILGKRGDKRKRIREDQRPKNDYGRGKEEKTSTNNELKEENKKNGQRKRKNNKYKKRKEER